MMRMHLIAIISLLLLIFGDEGHGLQPECISTCDNMADGPYASCLGCNIVTYCRGTHMLNHMCPDGQYYIESPDNLSSGEREVCSESGWHENEGCAFHLPAGRCFSSCADAFFLDMPLKNCENCFKFNQCTEGGFVEGQACWGEKTWSDETSACEDGLPACRVEEEDACVREFTQTVGHQMYAGKPETEIDSLDECKTHCLSMEACIGIDWNKARRPWMKTRCWILTDDLGFLAENANVDHYELSQCAVPA